MPAHRKIGKEVENNDLTIYYEGTSKWVEASTLVMSTRNIYERGLVVPYVVANN